MLKTSASESCSFGLFGLSRLSRLFGLFGLSLFIWLNQTNQMNQRDQMDQTDRACPRCAGRRSLAVLKWFSRSLLEKNAAGYCEALPILVQQRPCAYMQFTVGVHFS